MWRWRSQDDGLVQADRVVNFFPSHLYFSLADVIFSSKYIIHTVGPIYNRCIREENARVLEKCYTNSLKLAADEKIRKIVGYYKLLLGLRRADDARVHRPSH